MASTCEPGKFFTPAPPRPPPRNCFLKGPKGGPQNDNTQIERMGIKTMCSLMP